VVAVEGRDRERFLQSQLSSDVRGLEVGASQQTAVLDRGGRILAFGFLYKRSDRIDLLLPEAAAMSAVRHLEAHVVADDVRTHIVNTPPMRIALGAEAVRRSYAAAEGSTFPIEVYASRGFVDWSGEDLGLPALDDAELETRRVLSGFPRWGSEVCEGTLIHESTLIDTAVSFTKGCFLGQETVAKVASGRGAARAPMLLEVIGGDPGARVPAGATFVIESAPKGGAVLASTRWQENIYIFAAVARELRVTGRELDCRFEDGTSLRVRTHALPFLAAPEPEAWARQLELRAVEAFAADREAEAITLYERAIAVCPTYADGYEGLGVILGRQRRFEEAIEHMRRLLEVDGDSVMAHTNLSLYYNQLGRIEDAENEAAAAMRAKMRREQAARPTGVEHQERTEAAAADRERRAGMFRQVLALDPDDALGNLGLGELLLEEGRYAEALEHLQCALRADPRYSAALLALGRAHESAENPAAARETYRRGIDVAAAKGDLATANKMQERLVALEGVND
jgi:folate-binding protein YgfZ